MATARYSPAMRSCLYTCRNNMTTTSSTTTTSTTSRTGAISTSLRPSFSTSAWLSGGGSSHESHYNPPTGWLWGIPPGQKYEKEGWEGLMYWGYCGGIGLAMIAYIYKPDTRFGSVFHSHTYKVVAYKALASWLKRVNN